MGRALILGSVFSVALCGCGDSSRVPTYAVSGKVVFPDGTPLPGGWIICESTDHALAARGTINVDGTFSLETYENSDGAVAGEQRVAITPATPEGFDPDRGRAPQLIDRRYLHMDTSGLEFDVTADGENYIELTVTAPGR